MKTETEESLFERIGGLSAVSAAVDLFYDKVLEDSTISHFFETTDMNLMRAKQKTFLAYAFGAPLEYEGGDLRSSHRHLVEKGLNDSHFNAVAQHLDSTLRELQVPLDVIQEVMTIAESTRHDILNK